MSRNPELNRIYKHYKGGLYKLLLANVEMEAFPGDPHVVYQSLQDNRIWCRPHDDFFDEVDYEGRKQILRFELQPE